MASIIISATVSSKLEQKHNVSREEESQCFDNRCGMFLIDDREDHRRDPPTLWFVADTRVGRLLKMCFKFETETCM